MSTGVQDIKTNILGNELANQQAKAGAEEMISGSAKDPVVMTMDAIAEIKRQIGEKWKLKFENSQKVERLQETFDEVGKRVCHGEKHRASFSALNQILCGHSRLNGHQAKLNPNKSELSDKGKVPESVEYYLFDSDNYS